MHVSAHEATALARTALCVAGASAGASELQADLLIDAELRGLPSHGLLRLPRLLDRIVNGVADPVVTGHHSWTGTALLSVDGQHGLGPVVATTALDVIAERARSTGVACAVIGSANHLGALAWYVRRVAAAGQICIAMTTSEAIVHPYGGRTALLGSNPIAIGVPARPRPLVFDMATSIVSMGKIHDYANRSQPLEQGWALDSQGEPTTDAAAARDGAIAPFGGAKGYGLGIALEVLVASMTGTALGAEITGTLDSTSLATKGDVFIVVQPRLATDGADSQSSVSSYLEQVRQSPPAHDGVPVSVPGDRSDAAWAATTSAGFEVPDQIWYELRRRAQQP
jgi:LDH2 family malate/lactate/ureidoglycolate dehydrogenase